VSCKVSDYVAQRAPGPQPVVMSHRRPPQQVTALEALPDWRWDEWVQAWEERCQQLVTLVQQHGRLLHARGSQSMPLLEGEEELRPWLIHQGCRVMR
jgi:hypothetical protein